MAKKSGVWILVTTIVKNLRQGLENPRCVGIEQSEQGYDIVRWSIFRIVEVIVTASIVYCVGQ